MDLRQPAALALVLSAALSIGSVVAWAACRWWYGKKLVAAAERLEKSAKGREFSQQQTLQARRQIEQLKAELEAHQRSAASHDSAQRRTSALKTVLASTERSALADSGRVPLVSALGFADTQILP